MPTFNKVDIEADAELIDIVPLGDCHVGNEVYTKKSEVNLRGYIKWIIDRPHAYTIGMGDMIESANAKGIYDMKMTPQEQIDYIVHEFAELAEVGRVLGWHRGNHEHWIHRDKGIDVSKMMAQQLKVKYLEDVAFTKLRLNDLNYHVYSTHGDGCAVTPAGKIQKLIKMRQGNVFDVGLKGHMHTKMVVPLTVREIDNRGAFIANKKVFVLGTGHFLDEGGYADRKGYDYEPMGAPRVQLFARKWDIHASE